MDFDGIKWLVAWITHEMQGKLNGSLFATKRFATHGESSCRRPRGRRHLSDTN